MTDLSSVKALTFDVFGTVVDWRGTIIGEGIDLGRKFALDIDWADFADAWRAGYAPAMNQVRTGALPWTKIDSLHRLILDELLLRFNITGLNDADIDHLNRVWHRLVPWPDTISSLSRMRTRYIVAALSNGNISLLVNMAKHSGIPWDCVLSAELARHYKPDPQAYATAATLLDLAPQQVMMVAAHNKDLLGAQAVGFRTAFIARPIEYGPHQNTDLTPDPSVDIAAENLLDLAQQLGA
jgi:2-haloacid dehalogenase